MPMRLGELEHRQQHLTVALHVGIVSGHILGSSWAYSVAQLALRVPLRYYPLGLLS